MPTGKETTKNGYVPFISRQPGKNMDAPYNLVAANPDRYLPRTKAQAQPAEEIPDSQLTLYQLFLRKVRQTAKKG